MGHGATARDPVMGERGRVLDLDSEKDPLILRQAAKLLVRENERLTDKVVALTSENLALKGASPADLQLRLAQLEAQLAVKNKLLFGKSSEKRPVEKTEATPEKKPQVGHGPREQPALPVVEKLFALDEADLGCPKCGRALALFAGQFEESEEITVVERRFVVVKQKRQKYRCECNGCIETAPGPVKLFPGARYSVDFAVEVATGKYVDHQPLERQVRTMAREGLVVDSQTLWDQIERLARILGSAKEALHVYVLAHAVIGADETRWRLLDGKGRDAGEAKQWQVWAVAAPDAVAYCIEDSRSAEAAKKALRDFKGAVMADGYGVYESLAKAPGSFVLANCWAHVRRKYLDAEHAFPAQAKEIVDLIGELYAVERLCPTGPPGDDLRRRLRDERSRRVVERIGAWAITAKTRALPESGLVKAIDYMLGVWRGLVRFLDDPCIPLDNNGTERGLRRVVIGRKNHYGSKSRRGTEVAALFYSLIESAKLAGIEPKAYLRLAAQAALRGEKPPLPHEIAAAA
jgi:transposase